MKSLLINATENSPKIDFNTSNNIFEISGVSRPENPQKFYEYLLQWVENYGKHLAWSKNTPFFNDKIILKMKLEYYNSTSAKYILVLLDKFNEMSQDLKMQVEVNWYYDTMDIDFKEKGEEYATLLPRLKFHFITLS